MNVNYDIYMREMNRIREKRNNETYRDLHGFPFLQKSN